MAEDRLYVLGVELLESIVDEFALLGLPLPPRQYVANGDVAFDCEQLVVTLERVYSGLPGQETTRRTLLPRLQSAQYAAYLVRCAPVMDDRGRPPEEAAMEASAITLYSDMNVMWRVIGTIWGNCRDSSIGTVEIVGPSGGYVAALARVAVQVQ